MNHDVLILLTLASLKLFVTLRMIRVHEKRWYEAETEGWEIRTINKKEKEERRYIKRYQSEYKYLL